MKGIANLAKNIGSNYPTETGRLKVAYYESSCSKVIKAPHIPNKNAKAVKIALVGDSTLDNGYWVQQDIPYAKKTATVTHQVAKSLTKIADPNRYYVANFAVDGATTSDITKDCRLDKVLPTDNDHRRDYVNQMKSVTAWQPDVVVLSVGGNNYREALQGILIGELGYKNLLFRQTPDESKRLIRAEFNKVKRKLFQEYKDIIDKLINESSNLKRIVISSQYLPELTQFTPYFIYTGFSHVARSQLFQQSAFRTLQNTINELYRDILHYVYQKDTDIEFVFNDLTSSMNPLGNNHTHQIEPNRRGASIMGRMIAKASTCEFNNLNNAVLRLSMKPNRRTMEENWISSAEEAQQYSVKKISQFISESRYRHVRHFFAPSSSLATRFESAYHTVMGKDFDSQYTGVFAFGLLDASLVTVMASYLWRATLNQNNNMAVRVGAGIISAPILIAKFVVGLALMLALSLPILGYHLLTRPLSKSNKQFKDEIRNNEITEQIDEDLKENKKDLKRNNTGMFNWLGNQIKSLTGTQREDDDTNTLEPSQ